LIDGGERWRAAPGGGGRGGRARRSGFARLKPGLRYAMLCGDGRPVLFEQGDIGFQIERHVPWLPKENVRHSFAWIKGAAGPAATQQVTKFTNAIIEEMRRHGVAGQKRAD
jgi:hypothetical protein